MEIHQKSDNRVIRVFISSTFRDMKEEREILVKRVFPQLRRLCEERGVTWGEVDLRWGVTEEQASEGKVLPICLEEIKRCRPYFIGILGERYGWVPDTISQDLIDHEPWLKTHLTHSVTELEILQGVLNDPDMAEHAFFYFRDPQYLKHLPKDVVSSDFISEDEESKTKLLRLKDRIEKSGFPLRKDYPDPIALSEFVLQDFTRIINTLYPPEEKIDALSRDVLEHEAYARSRAEIYIGRKEYFDMLNAHAIGNGQPLVVLGESGSGKSALLSNWALQYKNESKKKSLTTKDEETKKLMFWQKNRSENVSGDVPIIMHFVGASSGSADWAAMLRRIMSELKRSFAIHYDIPDNPFELRSAFANWLHMVSAKGRVVIILDAVNQLDDRDGALDLVWLPSVIPDKVRLILSTLPGRSLDELKKRNWPIINIQPFDKDERGRFIEKYLAQYTKMLSPSRVDRIANTAQTANPLYIKVLLEELRLFGEHEKLDERINFYLEAKNPNELYSKVLARWEEDFEDENGLVGNTMSLLWAARRGLTESEILEILGKKGDPLPRAKWSPLFLAARESLVSRMGLFNFSHDFLRKAVKDRYIPTAEQQKAAHIRLADYFEGSELNTRKIEEFPWQIAAAQSWQRLYDILKELSFFNACWLVNSTDLKAYWAQIEEKTSLRLVEAFSPYLETPGDHVDYLTNLASFLFEMGHIKEAKCLQEFLIEHFRRTEDQSRLAYALGNLITLLLREGNLIQAAELQNEFEQIHRRQGNVEGLAIALIHKARAHLEQSHLDEALNLYTEAESICRVWDDKTMWVTCLSNIATIYFYRKDYDRAMQMNKEVERCSRETGNQIGLASSYGNQASILIEQNHLDEAMNLFKEQERLCRLLGDRKVLSPSLAGQAYIMGAQGRFQQASDLYEQAEQIVRDFGDRLGLARLLLEESEFFRKQGDQEKAAAKDRESQELLGTMPSPSMVYKLIEQAKVLKAEGDLDGALRIQVEIERICRLMGEKQALAACLGNQGNIYFAQKNYAMAMSLYKKQECVCREISEKKVLADSLFNQSLILKLYGDLKGAMGLQKDVEKLCQETGNLNALQASLGGQAEILQSQGLLNEAVELYKKQVAVCRQLGNPSALVISLSNQANLLAKGMGQPDVARPLAQEAYSLAMKSGINVLAQHTKRILDAINNAIIP